MSRYFRVEVQKREWEPAAQRLANRYKTIVCGYKLGGKYYVQPAKHVTESMIKDFYCEPTSQVSR